MRHMWKKFLSGVLTGVLMMTCFAGSGALAKASEPIHVAGSGDDKGTGTIEAPYRTFDKAVENLKAGDTVIVHKGVYYKGDSSSLTAVGTADNPIVIRGCTDENCAICAKNADLPGAVFTSKENWKNTKEKAKADYFLKLLECSYVEMSHLYITGYQGAGLWPNKSDHITISDMYIWDMDTPEETGSGVEGILINDTKDSTFKNLAIWDIGQTRRSQADHGLYIGRAENCTFENIKVQDVPGAGIQFYSGENYDVHAKNCVIQNNVFSGCKYGLILVGVDGFTITNNTFYNSGNTDVYMDWTTTNNLVQNNLFYNDRTEKYTDPLYGQDDPAVVGYQWSSIKTETGEKTVKNNTFLNNIYDYCGAFNAIARYCTQTSDGGLELKPYTMEDFVAMQNEAPEQNKFVQMTSGKADIVSGIDTRDLLKGDDNEARIFANMDKLLNDVLAIKKGSACIGKGVNELAPQTDILGRKRDTQMDVGAYEYVGTDPVAGTKTLASDLKEDVPEETVSFSDIANHWAKKAIESMAKKGIISGYPDGTVGPDRNSTRAEFVAMIVRTLELDTKDTASEFSDVKTTDWYAGVIAAAVKANLVNGVGEGEFAPNKTITREEAMVMVSNVLAYLELPAQTEGTVLEDYEDAAAISDWAKPGVVNLVGYGLISGSNGKLNAKNNITRGEVCTILNYVVDFVTEKDGD